MLINRRKLMGTGAAAAAASAVLSPSAVFAAGKPTEKVLPTPSNPFGARSYIYTIVTPDIDASIRFYSGIMENEIIDHGTIGRDIGAIDGVVVAGRKYVLLRHDEKIISQRGVLRLIEAPAGASANRPRPTSQIMDPGLAIMETHPQDWQTAFRTLAHNNVEIVSPPEFYFHGAADQPKGWNMSWSIFGPAGEQIFVSSWPDRPQGYWGLFGPLAASSLMCRDRWPLWDFYDAMFGLKPSGDVYLGPEELNYKNVNTMINAPIGTYAQFGMMGDEMTMEWWEYRQWKPTEKPMWPTSLGRTGLAMTTIIVDKLSVARSRAKLAGIAVLGEGGLPSPDSKTRDAFFVRGAVGELIEVVGRG